jgi:hypothetical protein
VLIRIVDGRNQPQFCRFLYSEIASGPTASEAICERVKSTQSGSSRCARRSAGFGAKAEVPLWQFNRPPAIPRVGISTMF